MRGLQKTRFQAPCYLMRLLPLLSTATCLLTTSVALHAVDFRVNSSADRNAIKLQNNGLEEEKKGNLEQALHYFDAAIQTDPSLWPAYYNRARIFGMQRKWELVVRDTTVVLHEPKWLTAAGVMRASANAELGRYRAALADFSKVIAFPHHDKSYILALNGRAWLLATCPDAAFRNGPLALEDAKRAAALRKNDPHVIDTLAAAFAEVGDFESAAGCEQLAIAAITPSMVGRVELMSRLQKRLASFKHHRPWRDGPD